MPDVLKNNNADTDPFLAAGGMDAFIQNFENKYPDKWLTPESVSEMLIKEYPNSKAVQELTTNEDYLIAKKIDNFRNPNSVEKQQEREALRQQVEANDPSMKPVNAMVSGGLTAASLFTPGANAVKVPKTLFDLGKKVLGTAMVANSASNAPDILSSDNLLSILGIGGNVATAKTALRGMPGIASALEGGLASGIDQAAQKGTIDPIDLTLSMGLNGAVGGFAGRFAKKAGETSPRKLQEMEEAVGTRPTLSSRYLVEPKTKTVINNVFRGGMGNNTALKENSIRELSNIFTLAPKEEKEKIKKNIINDVFARVNDRISGPITGEGVGKFRAFVDHDPQFRELLAKMYGKSGPSGFSAFAHAMDTLAKIEHPELRFSLSKGAVRDTLAYLHVQHFVYFLSPTRIAENIQQGKLPLLHKLAQSAEEIAKNKETAKTRAANKPGGTWVDVYEAGKEAEEGNWINQATKDVADTLFAKKDKAATSTAGLRAGFREALKGEEPKGGDPIANIKKAMDELGFEKIKLQPTQTPHGYLDYVRNAAAMGMN